MTERLAALRALGADVVARHAADVDSRARFPTEALAALRRERLLGISVPESEGGAGCSIGEVASLCEVLGRYCASTAMIFAMHHSQALSMIRHAGTSVWHRTFMRRMVDEQLLLASATSEAGVDGNVRTSLCAVEEADGRFSLAKQASVISYGEYCDAILVTARRTPQAPPSDQVLVVVPRQAGWKLTRVDGWDTMGMRGTCSNSYQLEAQGAMEQIVPAPYADIAAQTMLPTSHIFWSAVWLGIATDASARARAFVRAEARRQPGSLPRGASRLAEAAGLLQAMRSNIASAVRQYEAALGSEEALASVPFAVAMNNLKTTSAQAAAEIVTRALRICGLAGYRNDSPFSVARHLRDVHSGALMVNDDRILANTANLLLAVRSDPDLLA